MNGGMKVKGIDTIGLDLKYKIYGLCPKFIIRHQ